MNRSSCFLESLARLQTDFSEVRYESDTMKQNIEREGDELKPCSVFDDADADVR